MKSRLKVSSKSDLAGSFAQLGSNFLGNLEEFDELVEGAYSQWILKSPDDFFAEALLISDEQLRAQVISSGMRLLAIKDPAAAEAALANVPGRYAEPGILASIAAGYAASNPARLKSYLDGLSSAQRFLLSDASAEIYRRDVAKGGFPAQLIFQGDRKMEAEALESLLQTGGSPSSLKQLEEWKNGAEKANLPDVYRSACKRFGEDHPGEIEAMLLGQAPEARGWLMEGLSQSDPEKSCKLGLQSIPDSESFQMCFQAWLEADSQAAADWIYSTPDGEVKTKAVLGIASFLERKGDLNTAATIRSTVAPSRKEEPGH